MRVVILLFYFWNYYAYGLPKVRLAHHCASLTAKVKFKIDLNIIELNGAIAAAPEQS